MQDRRQFWPRAALLASFVGFAAFAVVPQVAGQSASGPQYDGNLLRLPVGFETWVFVGSNLGLGYDPKLPVTTARESARADRQLYHNIYLNPEAYRQFVADPREFPDLTVLVMDVYTAADKGPPGIVTKGSYNGERVGIEVAVKNSRRPDGNPTPWAYYTFMNPFAPPPPVLRTTAKAHDNDECQDCHKAHASTDNVWVQFYPTLRKLIR